MRSIENTEETIKETDSKGSIKKVSTKELHELLTNGEVALFDIRGDVAYEQGHIPGAKTAPRGSLSFRVASNVNPDTFVVIYADGRDRDGAIDAVERLEGLRLTNVHLYEEGLEGWWLAGHDLVESPNAKVQARGPVEEVRSIIVDRENAYGGAFRGAPSDTSVAGG
jgi:rhodanese-related sulfurtransferase